MPILGQAPRRSKTVCRFALAGNPGCRRCSPQVARGPADVYEREVGPLAFVLDKADIVQAVERVRVGPAAP